jgi:hypothetical protein
MIQFGRHNAGGEGMETDIPFERTIDVSVLSISPLLPSHERTVWRMQGRKNRVFWKKVSDMELCYKLFGHTRVVCKDSRTAETMAWFVSTRMGCGVKRTHSKNSWEDPFSSCKKKRKVKVKEMDGSVSWITLY